MTLNPWASKLHQLGLGCLAFRRGRFNVGIVLGFRGLGFRVASVSEV